MPESEAVPFPSSVTFPTLQLDSRGASRPLWLVKVPKYLAQAWKDAAKNDANVGSMTITKLASENMEITLKIKDTIATAANIGSDYDVPITSRDSQQMAVLTQNVDLSDPGRVAMDGYVNRRADIRPKGATAMKIAQLKSDVTSVKSMEYVEHIPTRINGIGIKRKSVENNRRPEKAQKKFREDKDLVIERLFAAFETNRYINFKDLVQFTQQPAAYLKEIIKEYCNYVDKNPHKDSWELKLEYRGINY